MERFEKRILHNVLGILTRTCNVHCDTKDHRGVALDEFLKCRHVALFSGINQRSVLTDARFEFCFRDHQESLLTRK
jgi:hypothetical protein